MRVDPMPTMVSQVGKPGVLPGVDLNCGWYSLRSVVDFHFRRRHNNQAMRHSHLPKATIAAFHPGVNLRANLRELVTESPKPGDVREWMDLLTANGPVVVSGKLGAASWGRLPGLRTKLGVNHFIVIVGAQLGAWRGGGRLTYKDPLQGDHIRHHSFDEMNSRIDRDVYYCTYPHGSRLLDVLGSV